MRSNTSTSMAQTLSFGSVRQSPRLTVEQLMVRGDFQAAFDTCERGLESILNAAQKDSRWVLILRICSAFMTWSLLHCIIGLNRCPSDFQVWGVEGKCNMVNLQVLISSTTFITVLYTVDTGHCGEVRGIAFTEDQKQTNQNQIKCIYIALRTSADISKCCTETQPKTPNSKQCRCRSTVARKNSLERLLNRGLSVASAGSFPIHRVFLAVVLFYMLFVRMDPAHPSSFPWISQMLQMLKQMWDAMFAPYYRA
uniref:Uncharacterized protein n=1 Tax=Oncorhynchus mykiss TaxID=8022 RepID=A0A8C7Q2D9_ONCMY